MLVRRFVNNYTNRLRRQVNGVVISKTMYQNISERIYQNQKRGKIL